MLGLHAPLYHDHRVAHLGRDIQRLRLQRKAVLHTGKIQQILHHIVKAVGLAGDHLNAAAKGRVFWALHAGDRLRPALDGGKRRTQLVRDGGDKFVFHALGFIQLARHMVDGVAELADLAAVFVVDARIQIALRDARGRGFDRADGAHDAANEKQPRRNAEQDHRSNQHQAGDHTHPQALVHQRYARNKAHRRDIARGVRQHRGNGHHLFVHCRAVHGAALARIAQNGAQKIIAGGRALRRIAGAGCHRAARSAHQHQLELILFSKLLHHAAQKYAAAFACLGGAGVQLHNNGGGAGAQCTPRAVVVRCKGIIQKYRLGHKAHQNGNQQAAAHPSSGNAVHGNILLRGC